MFFTRDRASGGGIATNGVIAGWWQKDPKAAEDYVASQSSFAAQQLAPALASVMFNADPQRATDWVTRLADPEARRIAITVMATQIGWKGPKVAAEWAVGNSAGTCR